MTSTPPTGRNTRRAACKACIGGLGFCTLGAVGFPVVSFLGFPRRLASDRPIEIQLDDLVPGQPEYVNRRGQQLIVLSRSDGPLVLSAACTHLGCDVIWDTSSRVFRCPCHGAQFDENGEIISGPVNTPMKKIPFEIKDRTLFVS